MSKCGLLLTATDALTRRKVTHGQRRGAAQIKQSKGQPANAAQRRHQFSNPTFLGFNAFVHFLKRFLHFRASFFEFICKCLTLWKFFTVTFKPRDHTLFRMRWPDLRRVNKSLPRLEI